MAGWLKLPKPTKSTELMAFGLKHNRLTLLQRSGEFVLALRGGVVGLCLCLLPARLMAEPDLVVEQPAGTPVASEDLITFPDRLVGSTVTLAFTLSNATELATLKWMWRVGLTTRLGVVISISNAFSAFQEIQKLMAPN